MSQTGVPVGPSQAGVAGLADRLNHLFGTVRRGGSNELWNNESASAQIAAGGLVISPAYLSQLRHGKRNNPSARHLACLADLFGVPMEYFFGDGTSRMVDGHADLSAAVPNPAVSRIVLLADGLSADGLAQAEHSLDQLRRREKLPSAINGPREPVTTVPENPAENRW